MPLAADKCILERDRVLDMLDEIIAQLPGELKQSRTIVESRHPQVRVLSPRLCGSLAQSVEHLTFNQVVPGSIPGWLIFLK